MRKHLRWFAESIADEVTGLGEPAGPVPLLHFEVIEPRFIYARLNDEEPSFVICETSFDRWGRMRVCWPGGSKFVERSEYDVASLIVNVHREWKR